MKKLLIKTWLPKEIFFVVKNNQLTVNLTDKGKNSCMAFNNTDIASESL